MNISIKNNIKYLYFFLFAILIILEKIFEVGSPEEVEIRGASIFVVEELKKLVIDELKLRHPEIPLLHVNSILLDHFLWDYRRRYAKELEYIPFHRTIGTFY